MDKFIEKLQEYGLEGREVAIYSVENKKSIETIDVFLKNTILLWNEKEILEHLLLNKIIIRIADKDKFAQKMELSEKYNCHTSVFFDIKNQKTV